MSDPHPPRDDHGPAAQPPAPAQPPVVAYVTPAPVWPQAPYPAYPAAPPVYAAPSVFPSAHCCCAGITPSILQPCPGAGGFMVCCRVCGLAKDEHDKGGHGKDEPKPEPPPEFSEATPEAFRARFQDVWSAVQQKRIPAGIIADCHALLLILLHALGEQAGKPAKKEAGGWFKPAKPPAPEPLERLKKLQKDGKLLAGVIAAAERINLDPGHVDLEPLGSFDRAKAYVQLIWQIADQGFEQVRWSDQGSSPPRAKAPEPEAHGGEGGHCGGHGGGHGH